MAIPLAIFYYLYLGCAVVFLFFSAISIFHLVKYGRMDLISLIVMFFYIGVSLAIFLISWGYTSQINWQDAIPILSSFQPETNFDL